MSFEFVTELYLIRHGIAAERGTYADDRDRPLTEKGRDRTTQVAERLLALGCRFDTLLTSALVRAVETATILVTAGLASTYSITPALAPEGDMADWLSWLAPWQAEHPQGTLALVGHEPDLSTWAQFLVTGTPHGNWQLKKAGVMGLSVPPAEQALGHSELFWLAPPRLLL